MFGGETSKDVEVVVDSPAALTLIRPEPAPGGTVARISVEEMMRKRADIAPNRTADAVPNPAPLMVTLVPAPPRAGLIRSIVGCCPRPAALSKPTVTRVREAITTEYRFAGRRKSPLTLSDSTSLF